MNRKLVSYCISMMLCTFIISLPAEIQPVYGEASLQNVQVAMFVNTVEAQAVVEVGDWVKYYFPFIGAPVGTPIPEWVRTEFVRVEGTVATARVIMHMTDGTETTSTVTVDFVSGGGTLASFPGFIIPVDTEVGDHVLISGGFNLTITGEVTGTYAGAGRTVVSASMSQNGMQVTYHWDKQTRIMLEVSFSTGGMTVAAIRAAETNMWPADPFRPWVEWWFWTVIAAVIAAAALASIYMRRRGKQPPESIEEEPEPRFNSRLLRHKFLR